MRFTIGRLMLVVALTGVTLAASRLHILFGLYAGGSSILAIDRLFYRLDRRRTDERPPTTAEVARLTFGSVAAGFWIAWLSLSGFATIFAAVYILCSGGIDAAVYTLASGGPNSKSGNLYLAAVPALFFAVWLGSGTRRALRKPATTIRKGAVTTPAPPPPD